MSAQAGAPTPTPSASLLARLVDACVVGVPLLSGFSIAAMQICMGLSIVLGLSLVVSERRRPALPLAGIFLAYAAAGAVSGLLAGSAEGALEALKELFAPLFVYVVVERARAPRLAQRCLDAFCLGAVAMAGFGLWDRYEYGPLYRVRGTLSTYMTYSGVLQLGLMVIAARVLFAARGLAQRLAGAAAALLVLYALFLSQTRGAWLGSALGLGCLCLLRAPRLVLALPALALLGYLLSPAPVQARMRSVGDLGDATLATRIEMWRAGRAMWGEHPIWGVGPTRTRERYNEFRTPEDERPWDDPPGHLHSTPIEIAAERGSIGILLWAALWVGWLRAWWGRWRRAASGPDGERALLAASLAGLGAFLAMGLFVCNWYDSEVLTAALTLFGLVLVPQAGARTDAGACEGGSAG